MDAITPRGLELNHEAARPLDAVRVARDLLHTTRNVALATLDPGGFPYAIMTNLIPAPDASPILFAARMALHARNIDGDPRVSITMAAPGADVLVVPRLTLSGIIEQVAPVETDAVRDRYLRHFPKSKLYLALPDAQLYRLRVEGVQLNGGPRQNAHEVTPKGILTNLEGAADLIRDEGALVESLNARPDLAGRIAMAAGGGAGRWRITSADPEGMNLTTGAEAIRWWFPGRATTAAEVEAAIARL